MPTLYIIEYKYIAPLEEVDRQLSAHVDWLNEQYAAGLFIASGRKIPRDGGIIIAKADSLEHLHAVLEKDPFIIRYVADFKIIQFEASKVFLENLMD